jgi:hypothetical protein
MIEFKSETDRVAFYDAIKEIDEQLEIVDAAKDQIKEIIHAVHDSLDLPKPMVRKVARLYHKRAGASFEEETSDIKSLYDALKKQ